jgi:hypothetical protein
MSTEEHQDRETSSRRQREVAEETIAGRGVIVAEYFDVCSRRLSWWERTAASALLEATADSDRPFDAVVVVGEYERAFYGISSSPLCPCSDDVVCGCGCPKPGEW